MGGLSNEFPPNFYRILAEDNKALVMNGSHIFEAPSNNKSMVFLDWFKPEAQNVWERGLYDLWHQVPFDGISLTHNTPSIDCDGGRPNCNSV